jgi:hypothetical protein
MPSHGIAIVRHALYLGWCRGLSRVGRCFTSMFLSPLRYQHSPLTKLKEWAPRDFGSGVYQFVILD